MRFHMVLHIFHPQERFATNFALELLLPSVDNRMSIQTVFVKESCLTDRAFMVLLLQMHGAYMGQ